MITEKQADILRERIADKYEQLTESGCWIWMGCLSNGYGRIRLPNTRTTAYVHRVMYVLKHGEIEDGVLVCHHCDVPCCVNPDHLYAGDFTSNIMDAVVRGRHISGFSLVDQRGDNAANRKMTSSQVLEIRKSNKVYSELAADYGMTVSGISSIKNRYTWRHI